MKYNAPFGSLDPDASFNDEVPEEGTEGSIVPAAAIEQPQREIVAVIEAAGLDPDAADLTQLSQAIAAMIAAGVQPNTMPVVQKAAAYTAVAGDKSKVIEATAGAWPLGFDAAATLGNGWWCAVRNSGAGAITLDPDGAELVDGAASLALAPGASCFVICDGAGFRTVGKSPDFSTAAEIRSAANANLSVNPVALGEVMIGSSAQTWQDVSASRSLGVTYYNTTGRPIQVHITTFCTTAGAAGSLSINGTVVAKATQPSVGYGVIHAAIIPIGASYAVTQAGSSATIYNWSEYR